MVRVRVVWGEYEGDLRSIADRGAMRREGGGVVPKSRLLHHYTREPLYHGTS